MDSMERGWILLLFILEIVATKIEKQVVQSLDPKTMISHTFTPIKRMASGR